MDPDSLIERHEARIMVPITNTSLPDGWAMAKLEELCFPPQYGWTTSAEKRQDGLKLLRTTDISSGEIDWSMVPSCREDPDEPTKYLLSSARLWPF